MEWWNLIAVGIVSIFIGIIGLFICLFFFPKWKLLDFPERYGLKRAPIPYPAGISIMIAFFLSLLISFLWFSGSDWVISLSLQKLIAVLVSLSIITIVSYIDDRRQLSPFFRLAVQIGVSVFLVWQGIYIEFLTNPYSIEAFHLPLWLGGIITVIWIIGCMNAINWLDGVPNLSVQSGMLSSFVIGILAMSPIIHQPEISVMAFCLAGALVPFVFGNFGKTRYILGDSGSMTIGFLLAVFSIFSGGKMATMLISMSIPIFDSIFVVLVRIIRKTSPFKGKDKIHLHDQLMMRGWDNWQIIGLYLTISLILGISVLFLGTIGKLFLIGGFGLLFFIIRAKLLAPIDKNQKNI